MPKVTVNLNSLRKRLVQEYNALTSEINEGTGKCGYIELHTVNIERQMDDLRNTISTICCSYIEGSEAFADISDDLPEFVDFNPNDY